MYVQSSYFNSNKVVDVDCGHSYALALTENYQIYSFGVGQSGTLGHGTNVTVQLKPKKIEMPNSLVKIIGIEAGQNHAAAITSARKAMIWGYGGDGRLGQGDFDTTFVPKTVDQLDSENIVRISCG